MSASFSKHVSKAVFPVAGRGTRFLPATKASPKEMLVVVNKPLIQYAVEEAYEAGIRQMIFITCHNKHMIEDHFDSNFELEHTLLRDDNQALLEVVQNVKPADMECVYIRQSQPLGLGHAIGCAEHLIHNEPFAVILADDLMVSSTSVLKQMVDIYNQYEKQVIAVSTVESDKTHLYGIIKGSQVNDKLSNIEALIEKPAPDEAPSNKAIIGRYILQPQIFNHLKKIKPTIGNEIQLTDAIAAMLNEFPAYAYQFEGQRYDCGNKLGYLQANIDLGLKDKDCAKALYTWLQTKMDIK